MKIKNLLLRIGLLLTLTTGNLSFLGAEEFKIVSFSEQFDFYLLPGSNLTLYPGLINGQPCQYHEAVPSGKKPYYARALYIGTGAIDLKKIVNNEQAADGYRLTVYRVMSLELDKGLGKGLILIEQQLSPENTPCLQGPDFNRFSVKLKAAIMAEEQRQGETPDVIKGWRILKQLECTK